MAKIIKCFTLAEVLIALTIIGIIAAITVPVIMANYQKQALKAAFTKTYSDLNNAARKFYSDNGISFSEYASSKGSKTEVFTTLMSYFNQSGKVSNMSFSTEEEDYDLTYRLKLLSGTQLNVAAASGNMICDNYFMQADLQGRLFRLNDSPSANTNGPVVCVDTNGLKNPNQYGKDYFLFIFTVDNQVIPMGMEHSNNTTNTTKEYNFFVSGSQYCSKSASYPTYNTSCAYYALNDISPSDSSKSYWKDFI